MLPSNLATYRLEARREEEEKITLVFTRRIVAQDIKIQLEMQGFTIELLYIKRIN